MPSVKSSTDPGPSTRAVSVGVIGAIPARYASTRFPGKPLALIAGRTMIEHVYRRAETAGLDEVQVLTDDERIAAAVRDFGGTAVITPEDCASGSDRIAWAARDWDAEAVVNIQGDEPLIDPGAIAKVAERLRQGDDPMVTLASEAQADDAENPNVVKVVCDLEGRALYFSRAPIPFERERTTRARRHIGIYGYRRETLLRLAALPRTPLEQTEGLEQLRALENGIPIRVLEFRATAPGVDTPEDIQRVENYLRAHPEALAPQEE